MNLMLLVFGYILFDIYIDKNIKYISLFGRYDEGGIYIYKSNTSFSLAIFGYVFKISISNIGIRLIIFGINITISLKDKKVDVYNFFLRKNMNVYYILGLVLYIKDNGIYFGIADSSSNNVIIELML